MAVNPIIAARNQGFLVSEAAGQRSREVVTIAQQTSFLPPGTLLSVTSNKYGPSATAAAIVAILMNWCDAIAGDTQAAVIVRDAEVNDAYLVVGALDLAAVTTQLATRRIYVRRGVLIGPGATFAMTRAADPALDNNLFGTEGLTALPAGGAAPSSEKIVTTGTTVATAGGLVVPVIP